jgi:hypothetical protein
MTTKDVLALALDALEKSKSALAEELAAWDIDPPLHHVNEAHDLCDAAITAIKQAQEPVTGFGKIVGTHGKVVEWPEFTEQAQEPVQSEHERIKAFLHKHKANALPDGACKTCEGEGEIGGQFSGGIQECPDCNGSGRAAPKQAEPEA